MYAYTTVHTGVETSPFTLMYNTHRHIHLAHTHTPHIYIHTPHTYTHTSHVHTSHTHLMLFFASHHSSSPLIKSANHHVCHPVAHECLHPLLYVLLVCRDLLPTCGGGGFVCMSAHIRVNMLAHTSIMHTHHTHAWFMPSPHHIYTHTHIHTHTYPQTLPPGVDVPLVVASHPLVDAPTPDAVLLYTMHAAHASSAHAERCNEVV